MPAAFDIYFENLLLKGLEYFNKYYGNYRAIVSSNSDPQKRGRIQLYSPDVGQTTALDIWVDPAFSYSGAGHGSFWPPEVGDFVRVAFDNGNASRPVIYWGGWFKENAVPEKLGYTEDVPTKRGWVTKAGHALVFNDASGGESLELSWKDSSAKLTIDDQAKVTIVTGNSSIAIDKVGQSINIVDENNNTIQMTSSGIVINTSQNISVVGTNGAVIQGATIDLDSSVVNLTSSASEPAVMGRALMTWLTSHQHGSGVGPTSPPTSPPGSNILSTKAKVG
jgi:uncharacterized protein involved in type VI secretion and phage assembly